MMEVRGVSRIERWLCVRWLVVLAMLRGLIVGQAPADDFELPTLRGSEPFVPARAAELSQLGRLLCRRQSQLEPARRFRFLEGDAVAHLLQPAAIDAGSRAAPHLEPGRR